MCVKLIDVTKRFGEKTVLAGLNLALQMGQCYAVAGASGIGKTTLLRVISGLETQDSGSVILPKDAVISYAFQEPRLFDELTVAANMSVVHPDRDSMQILQELDLSQDADKFPDELSGGMKKRAGLARALAKQADIYLIDEPTGGQDAQRCLTIAETVSRYTKGSLCLVSTHDASLVSMIADHLIVFAESSVQVYDHIKDRSLDEIQTLMR
ncbi:MAG: ATP-binding cassette domain-containing protein [Clostridia bacterium]|nr:ATP-binding cassette domain-containing protein [Clostridia bacterium]